MRITKTGIKKLSLKEMMPKGWAISNLELCFTDFGVAEDESLGDERHLHVKFETNGAGYYSVISVVDDAGVARKELPICADDLKKLSEICEYLETLLTELTDEAIEYYQDKK